MEAVASHANTKEAVQQKEQAHQAALMPRLFDGLRSIFGQHGPCAKPMTQASRPSACSTCLRIGI